jgi:hypothetical protein
MEEKVKTEGFKIALLSLAVVSVVISTTVLAVPVHASGNVILDDQFTSPTLSPDWSISPGRGNYSLTDNSGYLRYIIDAMHTGRSGEGGYDKSLWLVRQFSGDQWILKAAITYNMRPDWPTNNRNMHFWIRTPGDGWNFKWIATVDRSVGVNDGNPGSNAMGLSAGGNYTTTFFPNSPNPLPLERWYFEIERNKDHVAVRASNDGNDSTFEYEIENTFVPSLGNDQVIEISGDGWYGSNYPPGYADFDFISVVSTAPTNAPVGGIAFSPDKLALLAPYIILAALIAIAAVSVTVYWRRQGGKK